MTLGNIRSCNSDLPCPRLKGGRRAADDSECKADNLDILKEQVSLSSNDEKVIQKLLDVIGLVTRDQSPDLNPILKLWDVLVIRIFSSSEQDHGGTLTGENVIKVC